MQWKWIEDGKEIRDISTVGCLGTWPDTAGIEKRLEKGHRRRQKIRETSKSLVGLPQ